MKCDWEKCTIGDLGEIITGKTPSTKNKLFWGGEIPFVTPGDIQAGKHIVHTERFVTEAGANSVKSTVLPQNSICVSCIGNIGYVGMTTQTSVSNQQINSIVVKNGVDPDYVYYLMKSLWNFFKNYEGQSTALSILNKTGFSKTEIYLPQLRIQKIIASVLSSLDDKIELNDRINANLEEQARAIFKSWFVDNPFQVEKETTLGNVCRCELGGTPSRNEPEYWNGNIPWINSGEVNEFRITSPSEYITEEGLRNSSTKLLPAKTTVLAITGATLGQVSLLEIESCANQSVVGIVPSETLPYEFIYPLILIRINELMSHQTGGAQQHINKQNIEGLPVAIPAKPLLDKYRLAVAPLLEMIGKNSFENLRLSSLRDALLPRLLSGELDVSKLTL